MVSSLTPPPTYVDPHLVIESATKAANKGSNALAKEEPDDEMDDGPQAGGSSSGIKAEVKKLKEGDLQWWQNDVEIGPFTKTDERYGVAGVSGTSTLSPGVVAKILTRILGHTDMMLRDELEIKPRQAVWSPSGLSDAGG